MNLSQTIMNSIKEEREVRKEEIINKVRSWINRESFFTGGTILYYKPNCSQQELNEVREFQKEIDEVLATMGLVTIIDKSHLFIEFLPYVNIFNLLHDAKYYIDNWLWRLRNTDRIIVLKVFLDNRHPEIKQYVEEQGFVIGSFCQSTYYICLPKEE